MLSEVSTVLEWMIPSMLTKALTYPLTRPPRRLPPTPSRMTPRTG